MAEVTEQQAADTVAENQEQPVQVQVKNSNNSTLLVIVLVVLMLVLAGAGFYLIQQLREQLDTTAHQNELKMIEMNKQVNAYQSQLAAMQSQLATMDADVTGKDSYFDKKITDFSELHSEKLNLVRKELGDSITFVQRQLGKTRGDWLVADAEYLLSVANQRLYLVGDLNTTREALIAADQRLRESGDASVFKVREQITKELDALNQTSMPDIVGNYATLQNLKEKVKELAVRLPHAGKKITESSSIHSHESPDDHKHSVLTTIFAQLEGYVTLRHSDLAVTEILKPEEAKFIKSQMGAKLELIKIAMVQENDALYKEAITDAQQWLKANFTMNEFAQAFNKELDQLFQVQSKGSYPDISVSLKMLRDIVKLRIDGDKVIMDQSTPETVQDTKPIQAPEPALAAEPESAETSAPAE